MRITIPLVVLVAVLGWPSVFAQSPSTWNHCSAKRTLMRF
jgi:hypothetical protein